MGNVLTGAPGKQPVGRRLWTRVTPGVGLVVMDALGVVLSLVLLRQRLAPWQGPALVAAVLGLLAVRGHFRVRLAPRLARDAVEITAAVAVAYLGVTGFGMHAQAVDVFHAAAVSAAILVVLRVAVTACLRWARRRRLLAEPTLLVGAGHVAGRVAVGLAEHPEFGLRPVGFIDDVEEGGSLPFPLLGRLDSLAEVLHSYRVTRVVIAFGVARESAMVGIVRACEHAAVDIYVLPRLFELGFSPRHRDVENVWHFPLVRLPRTVLHPASRATKRVFDVVAAGLMLLVLAPLYGLLALAVRLSSPGPIYFRQARVGCRGTVVEVLKFRSMRVNDDSDTTWDVAGDDRVTRVGKIMRPLSLDELPQLWNVLRGDMSLVGPRPERPFFVQRFGATVAHYDDRHRVPVGLTGLAQVSGLRGDTSIAERIRLDNAYIENWSLWQDIEILLRTALAVVRHARGAAGADTPTAESGQGTEAVSGVMDGDEEPVDEEVPAAGAGLGQCRGTALVPLLGAAAVKPLVPGGGHVVVIDRQASRVS